MLLLQEWTRFLDIKRIPQSISHCLALLIFKSAQFDFRESALGV